MLVLFESPAGYGLFKVSDSVLKADKDSIWSEYFEGSEDAKSKVKLSAFEPFKDTAEAVLCSSETASGTVSKKLGKFLKKNCKDGSTLGVLDTAMASGIKDKVSVSVVSNDKTFEVLRGIRELSSSLMKNSDVSDEDVQAMTRGLSHQLSRYKLKFSPDKVDTMIVQAIGLLDELDKEVNTYAMRVKEWYGWHFPELQKVLADNTLYAKFVVNVGMRTNAKNCDLSEIYAQDNLDESTMSSVKELAEISMGTEIAEMDIINIQSLATQVLSMSEYRSELSTYLENRMNAIAPNLTQMVGTLVGARLIAHSGSLVGLAKLPASTVQILGAEKALFRALKTKHDTPKYGLIYHASLVGQVAPKNKGKIARVLAAKTSLAVRVDALSDEPDSSIGMECRAKVEARALELEGGVVKGPGKSGGKKDVTYVKPNGSLGGEVKGDMVGLETKKRKAEDDESDEKKKKKKKDKKEKKAKKDKKEKKSKKDKA